MMIFNEIPEIPRALLFDDILLFIFHFMYSKMDFSLLVLFILRYITK